MSQKNTFLNTTIGMKILMAFTGLSLVGFLTSHLAGNFLLFDAIGGKESFNDYAHWLVTHPLIIPMELGLLAIFLIHLFSAVKVSLLSKAARPDRYAVRNNLGESSFASRTMIHTGGIILVFIILHLITFKWGDYYPVETGAAPVVEHAKDADGKVIKSAGSLKVKAEKRDLHKTVVKCFSSKGYSLVYILCMIALGIHLCHGIRSAFQTLGLNHPKYNCCVKKLSCILAIVFAVGYSIFPIYFGFINPVQGG